MDLLFSGNFIKCNNATVSMRDPSWFHEVSKNACTHKRHSISDPVTERIQSILNINYASADLDKVVQESAHFSKSGRR